MRPSRPKRSPAALGSPPRNLSITMNNIGASTPCRVVLPTPCRINLRYNVAGLGGTVGQEIECKLRYQRKTLTGKAYLETDFVLFRGEERLKVPFRDLKAVTSEGGKLTLDFTGGPAVLELGAAAEKWARKILNPPSRLDKLGV